MWNDNKILVQGGLKSVFPNKSNPKVQIATEADSSDLKVESMFV